MALGTATTGKGEEPPIYPAEKPRRRAEVLYRVRWREAFV